MLENVKGFHDITIFASNVPQLREFYSKLGFPLVVKQGDGLAVFSVGRNELAIHSSPTQPKNSVGLTFLVEDVGVVERHLISLGIPFQGPKPVRPGLNGITLLDPNGNTLAFLQPRT